MLQRVANSWMFYFFLGQGADINFINKGDGNKTPVHASVIEGFVSGLMLLAQNRAEMNTADSQSWTPLHYAAQLGRTNCVAILFKNGAKIDVKDANGQTPLDLAVVGQKADCVTYLRLAMLAISEGGAMDESFMEALQNFTYDTQHQSPV